MGGAVVVARVMGPGPRGGDGRGDDDGNDDSDRDSDRRSGDSFGRAW